MLGLYATINIFYFKTKISRIFITTDYKLENNLIEIFISAYKAEKVLLLVKMIFYTYSFLRKINHGPWPTHRTSL